MDFKKIRFDVASFYAALNSQRQSKKLTWKQVAEQSGVAASTLTRMAQGKKFDLDGLAALLSWSGLKAELFIQGDKHQSSPELLAQITAYLRSDPHLTPEGAEGIESVLRICYESLRKSQSG